MYSDRLNDSDALFGNGSGNRDERPDAPTSDRAKLAQACRLAEVLALQVRYEKELFPALRAAARAKLEFAIAAFRAGELYAEFDGHGIDIPAPQSLMVSRADLLALAKAMTDAGLIDQHDIILTRIPTE